MCGLFAYKFMQYRRKAAYEVMGHCVCMAKGAAETLKLNMAIILLPVCRNTITWLRNKTKLGIVVPFDDNLNFHKVIDVAIAIGVGVHVVYHLTCDFPRLLHANSEKYKLMEPFFGNQPTNYWHFVKSWEGVTGISMVVLMTIAFTMASPWLRRGRVKLPKPLNSLIGFNAFWYSHHLFVFVYVLLVVHGIKLYLTKEWYKKTITFELTVKQLMIFDPDEWTESLRREYMLVIEGFFTIPFPLLSPTYRRAIRARTKVAEALTVVVKNRRKEFETKEERNNDMLGALLASGEQFLDEGIVDFMLALLVAGYETTSTIMTLAIKFLTETPLALAQLKEEHEQIRARSEPETALEWTDYKSMAFSQCVVNETLRVANIIGAIFRRTTTEINIKGYTIPKGWTVITSFRAVHLNPEYFKDARTFNPWRWQSNNNSEAVVTPGNVFTPFGGGPRLCPGYELARVVLSVFLHHFVTRFSWIPAEEDKLVFFPTTRTQKRYPIILKRREESRPKMGNGNTEETERKKVS